MYETKSNELFLAHNMYIESSTKYQGSYTRIIKENVQKVGANECIHNERLTEYLLSVSHHVMRNIYALVGKTRDIVSVGMGSLISVLSLSRMTSCVYIHTDGKQKAF